MKTYIQYLDDGPVGITGQGCSSTNPWNRLYIFNDEESAYKFMREVELITNRKNPRVGHIWYDGVKGMAQEVYRELPEDPAAKLRKALADLVGASTKEDLIDLKIALLSAPGIEQDKIVAVNAINALIETA